MVDGAVTGVDEVLPGGAGGDEAKTLSLETSVTGGRAPSSKTWCPICSSSRGG